MKLLSLKWPVTTAIAIKRDILTIHVQFNEFDAPTVGILYHYTDLEHLPMFSALMSHANAGGGGGHAMNLIPT